MRRIQHAEIRTSLLTPCYVAHTQKQIDIYRLSDKFSKVKFSDTEAVSELSEDLTLPKISRYTVLYDLVSWYTLIVEPVETG